MTMAKGLLFGLSLALSTLLNIVESSMAWKKATYRQGNQSL